MKKLQRIFHRSFWRTIGSTIGLVVLAGLITALAVFGFYAKDLPNPSTVGERLIAESTKIYDSSGEVLLFNIHGEIKRTIIPFNEIPNSVKWATIALEDANFYNHFGIDFRGIARAVLGNLRRGTLREGPGGSTITQQFIKNTILTPEKSLSRKIREWILAIELERRYEKDEILDFYLNQIPYGSNAYGIEAAAQTYFDKHARDLTLAESAVLAALPQAPTFYSPYGSHRDSLLARKNLTLNRMAELGYITEEEAEMAKKEEITFADQRIDIEAPHFVMFVREYLEKTYGSSFVERGGLKVITTLDMHIQKIAEEAVVAGAESNEDRFGANNAAAVVIDPKNGKVRAMVGSRDFFNEEIDGQVNVTVTPQQPGSSFKPIAYVRAFEKGYSPNTYLFDLETNFGVQGAEVYAPQNYDGNFRGPMTMREALAQSINVPAVKTLYLSGFNDVIDLAEQLGISTFSDRSRFGLSLVLGGGDVFPLELTNAYAAFANDGLAHPYAFIERVEDKNGNILETFEENSQRVLNEQAVRLLTDVLSDNTARVPTFGVSSSLVLPNRPAAVKTGTTQDSRDAWTIGYTPQLVTGVWVGNTDNTPMNRGGGSSAAGPIWNEIMRRSLEGTPIEPFIEPDSPQISSALMVNGTLVDDRIIQVDTATNTPATPTTPPQRIEHRRVREVHSILYYIDPEQPLTRITKEPSDSQLPAWEEAVSQWAQNPSIRERHNLVSYEEQSSSTGGGLSLQITTPQWGERIQHNFLQITANASSPNGVRSVEFFWDGTLIGTDATIPYQAAAPLTTIMNGRDHVITVRAFDQQNRSEVHIPVIIDFPVVLKSALTVDINLPQETPSPLFEILSEDSDGNSFSLQLQSLDVVISRTNSGQAVTTLRLRPNQIANRWSLSWDNPISGNYTAQAFLQTLGGELLQSSPRLFTVE